MHEPLQSQHSLCTWHVGCILQISCFTWQWRCFSRDIANKWKAKSYNQLSMWKCMKLGETKDFVYVHRELENVLERNIHYIKTEIPNSNILSKNKFELIKLMKLCEISNHQEWKVISLLKSNTVLTPSRSIASPGTFWL